jgi:hypothetical protein
MPTACHLTSGVRRSTVGVAESRAQHLGDVLEQLGGYAQIERRVERLLP